MNFYERWIEDKNKGRFDGMKVGYVEASKQYEHKFQEQEAEFDNQKKNYQRVQEEREELLNEYEEYIEKMQTEPNDGESKDETEKR